jgi:hypothetical protein
LIGKITRRSPFDGYTDPEKNKAVIMHDVFSKGDSYFNTGDLVRNIGFRHAQFVDVSVTPSAGKVKMFQRLKSKTC